MKSKEKRVISAKL